MISTSVVNTQLIEGLVQTLLALSTEEQKLLFERWEEAKTRYELEKKLDHYEKQYGLSSQDFYAQFLRCALGDGEDYLEWAGFYGMLQA